MNQHAFHANLPSLTPLMRHTVGFEPLLKLLSDMNEGGQNPGYPPHDIIKHDDENYTIELALAGFGEDEISVEQHENTLTISAGAKERGQEDGWRGIFIHKGIARRSFVQKYRLADHIEVKAARMDNGILRVEMERHVPEEKKPRRIAISGPSDRPLRAEAA